MNLREEIAWERSKTHVDSLADWVGSNPQRFKELMAVFLQDEDGSLVQRAAWIINIIAERHPQVIMPHLGALVERMETPAIHPAIKRHVMSSLQYVDIPESLHGPVMNAGFTYLEDPEEPIAVRAFSMTILADLAVFYPEIRGELRLIIENMPMLGASAGLRARARKVLKAIGNA
jgi:hypothetical protein